jgi:catechol 2,3-dioxygenase-like lactoylglutathione lyase family enzyme
MSVAAMNHFTVLSDDLEVTRHFYCDLFGFKVGWRPPFQFPGWWLYADGDDKAILHVIQQNPLPQERAGVLDHMAFTAKDLPGTVATLRREGIDYELRRLPGGGIWQLFFHDPHGAKVEFDFAENEPAPVGYTEAGRLASAFVPVEAQISGYWPRIPRRCGYIRDCAPAWFRRCWR